MIVTCPSCCTRYAHRADPGPMTRARCSQCDESFFLSAPRRSYVLMPEVATAGAHAARDAAPAREFRFGMDDPALAEQVRTGGPVALTGVSEPLDAPEDLPCRMMTGEAPLEIDRQDPSATQALDSEAVQAALRAAAPAPVDEASTDEYREPEPVDAAPAMDPFAEVEAVVEPDTSVFGADPNNIELEAGGEALRLDPGSAAGTLPPIDVATPADLPEVPTLRPAPAPRKAPGSRTGLGLMLTLLLAAGGGALGYYYVFPLPYPLELPVEVPWGWSDAQVIRTATGVTLGLLLGWMCLRRLRPRS